MISGQPTDERLLISDIFEGEHMRTDRPDLGTLRDPARAAYWSQRTVGFHGVVTWSPTVDPERLKLASQEIVLEQRVRLVFHSWAAMPLMEAGKVRGAGGEPRHRAAGGESGRAAIRARRAGRAPAIARNQESGGSVTRTQASSPTKDCP